MAFPEKMKHSPNLVLVAVNSSGENQFSGEMYHQYEKEPGIFADVNSLVLAMDNFFDSLGFPQAQMKTRQFKNIDSDNRDICCANTEYSLEELVIKRGKLGTFLIEVERREKASWQGNIYWIEKDEVKAFQSDVELVKLIVVAVTN
ncbi:MAG: hypothetical protein HUJ71_04600 [Pseudobutyrivibrio sp.]|nr:hypothetical protein [Pseudobutyrivibrio sp.]